MLRGNNPEPRMFQVNGHAGMRINVRFAPKKRTSISTAVMSALCH
jgi:hypothetical protein